MDFNAIRRVTTALKVMLDDAVREANGGAAESVFVGPLDDPGSAGFKLVLFLYRVSTNPDLRSSTHVVPSADPNQPPAIYENSLPLDLHYLLTGATQNPGIELTDLSLLGRAMQALQNKSFLAGVAVQNETVRISMDPVSSEDMSRIWSLFPAVNYRTSVIYLATPVWIDPARPTEPGPPVVEEPHVFGQSEAG
jgi:hypothetical protein